MEKALAYVCCPADAGKAKVQKYCRKIYELGYVPICPQFSFSPFLDEGEAEDMQAFQRMSHMVLRRKRNDRHDEHGDQHGGPVPHHLYHTGRAGQDQRGAVIWKKKTGCGRSMTDYGGGSIIWKA